MIARIWHGITSAENAEEYIEVLKKTGVVNYQSTPGNQGVDLLHRIDGNIAHFTLLTLWDSLASIQAFAGEDYEKAVYYPEDKPYLLEYEEHVTHWDVEAM